MGDGLRSQPYEYRNFQNTPLHARKTDAEEQKPRYRVTRVSWRSGARRDSAGFGLQRPFGDNNGGLNGSVSGGISGGI